MSTLEYVFRVGGTTQPWALMADTWDVERGRVVAAMFVLGTDAGRRNADAFLGPDIEVHDDGSASLRYWLPDPKTPE